MISRLRWNGACFCWDDGRDNKGWCTGAQSVSQPDDYFRASTLPLPEATTN